MSVQAKYASRCGMCDGPISVGDEIEECDDEWCHKECADEANANAANED